MKLLDVKTSFVPFPPYLDINQEPVDVFDKLTSGGYFYNHILRIARLNATVSRSEKMGECLWIDNRLNCSGIFGELVDNQIDFSFYAQQYEDYDDRDLFTQLRMSSQIISQSERVFMATAQEHERTAKLTAFNFFEQFPLSMLLLNFLALFLVVLVINLRLKSRDKRIDILDALILHTLHWSRDYKANHRRIMFYTILLYCCFTHWYFSAQVKTDMIVSKPAQFLTSLQDIVESNRTPAIFDGMALKNEFVHSNDKNKLLLVKRAADRGTLYPNRGSNCLTSLSRGISELGNVGLFSSLGLAINVGALVCLPLVFAKEVKSAVNIPEMKITTLGTTAHSGYMFSRESNLEVRKRLENVIFWLVESGQFFKLGTDPVPQFQNIPGVNREQLVYCLSNMGKKDKKKAQEIVIDVGFFLIFGRFWSTGMFIAFVCLVAENLIVLVKQVMTWNEKDEKECKETTCQEDNYCRVLTS